MSTATPTMNKPQADQPNTRRKLHFHTMRDILDDVETLTSGPVESLGKWTPAQNIEHIRLLILIAHRGVDFKMPLPFRVIGKVFKGYFLKAPFRAGFKTVDIFEPPAEITMQEAVTAFREEMAIADRPGAMSHPSPLLGTMTHEQWVQLHCRHAELHLSFLVPASAD